ncbi:LAQU0S04e02872g1_1 [Lachancea quebecensis]|uniref:LAQU0S04e02872g1_1 n=1 Tax=Lachancea quebecensis TaxID=1654605 RepID=A0A0P1KPZ7_9SACH|nr:LAQU0S04e02872g1_1 [Lachancea quebecensis]
MVKKETQGFLLQMASNKSNMSKGNSRGAQAQGKNGRENAKKQHSKENSEAAVVSRSDNEAEGSLSDDDQEAASGEESLNGSNSEQSEEDDAEEEEEDDDFPHKKKAKLSKHDDGSSGFSTAVNAILGSHLKAHDRKDPIMARKRGVVKKLESDKLEQKAKRALLAEKKKLLNKTRKKDIIPTVSAESESGVEIREILEKERRLRKIAQKGVVKLFNAILSTQVKTEKEGAEKLGEVKNRAEKKELLAELSKEKFLDLVKAAGDS